MGSKERRLQVREENPILYKIGFSSRTCILTTQRGWLTLRERRLSYSIAFKIEVVNYAEKHGNRAAERRFGSPPTEKMIRECRKQRKSLIKADKSKELYVHVLLNGQNLKNMLRTG